VRVWAVKFVLFLILFCPMIIQAKVQSLPVTAYIQSDRDIIKYSQLDVLCTLNNSNQSHVITTTEIKTTRVNANTYELAIAPIKLNTPTIKRLINCNLNLLIYIEPRIYLRFLVVGSESSMTEEELKVILDNPEKLTALLSKRVNHAKLVRAKNPQGYALQPSN
jgi:hypothetical protein